MVKVYKCLISGDELISDSYNISDVKDAEGNVVEGLFKVESKNIPKGGENFDIGCGNEFGGEGDAEVDNDIEMVNNVVDSFGYTQTSLDGNGFKGWLKDFMGAILEIMKKLLNIIWS